MKSSSDVLIILSGQCRLVNNIESTCDQAEETFNQVLHRGAYFGETYHFRQQGLDYFGAIYALNPVICIKIPAKAFDRIPIHERKILALRHAKVIEPYAKFALKRANGTFQDAKQY